ncbi:SURF1 family cytochrome oxidase biogenesis protein [Gryllotalpicola sp.]|uniref:SURF1 family cytochrome oxidase biogenesis protein n=1 Tax=Gryllotalpicola sp. TaxID=1932787 RepID=UPI00261F839B|nr:SURF1 family cytochrome oxidase biogenesis protein [Gryllotalpicola sp.]
MSPRHPGDLRLVSVMVRPRWIIALLLALAVAGIFAWLGQWQLGRAIASGQAGPTVTEATVPLDSALQPGVAIADNRVGQLVTVSDVTWAAGDFVVSTGRNNNGSDTGYWILGHAIVPDGSGGATASLAVALGFTSDAATAKSVQQRLDAEPASPNPSGRNLPLTLTGRLLPTDPPEQPQDSLVGDPPRMDDVAVALLVNVWKQPAVPVYEAYLVARDNIPAGLDAIYSPPPYAQTAIDWLNAFYAAEWALFAGFALYLWYRVTRDVYERELEDMKLNSEGDAVE